MVIRSRFITVITVTIVSLSVLSSALPIPEIEVARTSDGLQISWTPVDADDVECFILYTLVHQVNGVDQTRVTLEDTSVNVPFSSCTENTFTLSTRCRTGAVVADVAEKIYLTNLYENLRVENLEISHEDNVLQASWSRPADTESCNIEYHVNVRTSVGLNMNLTTESMEVDLGTVQLTPCAKFEVTVTPFEGQNYGASKSASFVADAGAAGGIENLAVNDRRIEWDESQDNGHCEVTYVVSVVNEIGTQVDDTTTDRFFDVDWVMCSLNSIGVSGVVGDNVISSLSLIHRPIPTEVGGVDDITLQVENRNLLVTWPPIVIGVCDVNYKLQHLIGDSLLEASLILETSYTFPTDFCADNNVTVRPSVSSVIGSDRSAYLTSPSAEPAAVENLRLSREASEIIAAWDSVNVGMCEIQYEVQHFANDQLIASKITSDDTLSLDNIISCSNNEIRVTAIAGDSRGQPSRKAIEISVESIYPVEDLEVTEVEEGLVVSWSPIIEGFCEIAYKITNFDGENTNQYQTSETTYVVDKTVCMDNKISVQGLELSTEIVSEIVSVILNVDIDLTKVKGLSVTRSAQILRLDWDRPLNAEYCEISYEGNVTMPLEHFNFRTEDTEVEFEIGDVEACSEYDVHVTPISPSGVQGQPNHTQHIWHLEAISRVQNLRHNFETLIRWDRPLDSGICELHYDVIITGARGEETFVATTNELEFFMTPCAAYGIHVSARDVLTQLTSAMQMTQAVGNPRILEEPSSVVHVVNRETLSLSWNAADAGNCNLQYHVSHENNGVVINTTVSQTSIDLETTSCSENTVTITPHLPVQGIFGEDLMYTTYVDLDELLPVQDITVVGNVISWTAPRYSGNCFLTYFVDILDGEEVVQSHRTSSHSATASRLIPCHEYSVRVTATYGAVEAVSEEQVTFVAPAEAHSAPGHLRTIPSLASAVVTLRANSHQENNCPIEEVLIRCDDGVNEEVVVTLPIEDNQSRVFEVTIPDLTFNTHYSCVAQWLPDTSPLSEPFEFYTMDIPIKDLDVSNVTSNEITISWEEPEGLGRYVLGYTVVILSVGPNHFLQESCNAERNYLRTVAVPAGTYSHTFTEALPNYRYEIYVVTSYNIGWDSTGVTVTVNTLPGVPGPIVDLQEQVLQEECKRYSADAVISWTPPCDINGDLDRFEVTVTTFYTVGGKEQALREESVLQAQDADEDYQFAIDIPSLNPFFSYEVSIGIVAAYSGQERAAVEIQPPNAYSVCSK